MGHTGATFEEASLAIANGVTSVTHTFNGQTALNHRKNGVAGAALRTDEIYSEMICDFHLNMQLIPVRLTLHVYYT